MRAALRRRPFRRLVFGWVLTTISLSFMVPRVYFPHLDPGILSLNLGWQRVRQRCRWATTFKGISDSRAEVDLRGS